jgi:hypothetical protein
MNKYAGQKQIREIAKRWNINDFDFFMDLIVSIPSMSSRDLYFFILQNWFFDRQMADTELAHHRFGACRTAA